MEYSNIVVSYSFSYSKMHGAGNDFVVIDSIDKEFPNDSAIIQKICNRKRGIGSDGLISLTNHQSGSIKMDFYNCDGSKADMCGNGLRCATLFAKKHLHASDKVSFITDAGKLQGEIISDEMIRINIPIIEQFSSKKFKDIDIYYGNSGVPHVVVPVNDLEDINISDIGSKIRYSEMFAPEGTNVNFIPIQTAKDDLIPIRSYERGVEGETSACGTGISAAAVVLCQFYGRKGPIKFITPDKDILCVELQLINNIVYDVTLTGPAIEVFSGIYEIRS